VLNSFKLIIPIFIPSWQFFKEIAPSPRIEFALLANEDEQLKWQELSPPARRNFISSLFYNPDWNRFLYIMNCAERLVLHEDERDAREIINYIASRAQVTSPYLQFRLVFIDRVDKELRSTVLYSSERASL